MYIEIYKYYLDLFEVHYELEATLPTSDDPANTSLELSMVPSSSSTIGVSGVSIQRDSTSPEDQLWVLEQRLEMPKCKKVAQITCGCTKAKGKP